MGITGAAFWGWAGVLIKQRSGRVPPMSLAAGSIAFSALLMVPFWVTAPAPQQWTLTGLAALIALGTICSGIAYLPFFTLIRDIGPSRTLTVGLAVPVLGVLWGWLFLGEAVTLTMLAGMRWCSARSGWCCAAERAPTLLFRPAQERPRRDRQVAGRAGAEGEALHRHPVLPQPVHECAVGDGERVRSAHARQLVKLQIAPAR